MSDHAAQHYLEIYRRRLGMAEGGVTHPKPSVVESIRQLVAGLSALSPDAKIRIESGTGTTKFRVASTGDLLAEFGFTNDA